MRGEIRNKSGALASAASAGSANRPCPVLPVGRNATARSVGAHTAGAAIAGAPSLSTAVIAAFWRTAAGARSRPPSVTKPAPFHQYAASIVCPPIIITARSLAETATLRLRGSAAFIYSPSVGTLR